jgi:hypothetical protein
MVGAGDVVLPNYLVHVVSGVVQVDAVDWCAQVVRGDAVHYAHGCIPILAERCDGFLVRSSCGNPPSVEHGF